MSTATKNLMPSLSDDEYAALEESILENGYWSAFPVAVDEHAEILDGFNRVAICEKHDLSYPTVVVKGLSSLEKATFAIKSNTTRRQLSPAQRKQVLKRLIEMYDAEAKAKARTAQAEGGRKGGKAAKGSLTETTSDKRARSAAAESSETRFDASVVAKPKKKDDEKVDSLATFGSLLGVSRATAARDKASLEREEAIEKKAKEQKRDDVLRLLNGPRPALDELERAVGLRDPLPEPAVRADAAEREGWVSALATALDHLTPALSDDEADTLYALVTEPSLLLVQLGQLRGSVAEAKKRDQR